MTLEPSAARSPVLDGRFLVVERLGSGGMGSVFRAFDAARGRDVAVKVVDGGGDAGPRHPLAAEFQAWSRLSHPNVVRAIGLGKVRTGPFPLARPYLVLEFFPGRPAHLAVRLGCVAPRTILEIARGVLRALDHVHGRGLVHRDVKPGNVLISIGPAGAPRVKLTDFGLAVETGHREDPGTISGSVPYLSPEALLGLPLDGRADLYGLGLVLHLLAIGRLPFDGSSPTDAIRWHLSGPRPEPDALRRAMDDRLARFTARLLARERNDRPESAAEGIRLLGPERPRGASRAPFAGRAERAALRLALDAVRLGATRTLEIPRSRQASSGLVEEARVLAEIHGLATLRIGGGRGGSLGREIFRLLLDSGTEAESLIERNRLDRALPIRVLGGAPVWDREREALIAEGETARAVARAAVGFLLEVAGRRSLLAVLERPRASCAVEREAARLLLEESEGAGAPKPGRGGLLVLFEPASA